MKVDSLYDRLTVAVVESLAHEGDDGLPVRGPFTRLALRALGLPDAVQQQAQALHVFPDEGGL